MRIDIEEYLNTLVTELNDLNLERIKLSKNIIDALLVVTQLFEEKQITLQKTDHLFGMFIKNDDLLVEVLHDIVLDVACLELPQKYLTKSPEDCLQDIRQRLYRLKNAMLEKKAS